MQEITVRIRDKIISVTKADIEQAVKSLNTTSKHTSSAKIFIRIGEKLVPLYSVIRHVITQKTETDMPITTAHMISIARRLGLRPLYLDEQQQSQSHNADTEQKTCKDNLVTLWYYNPTVRFRLMYAVYEISANDIVETVIQQEKTLLRLKDKSKWFIKVTGELYPMYTLFRLTMQRKYGIPVLPPPPTVQQLFHKLGFEVIKVSE